MKKQGNTILVTGGGSGIGCALAHRWHDRGNKVIIAGREAAKLEQAVAGRSALSAYILDIGDAGSVSDVAKRVVAEYPDLNVLVNNAGASFEEDPTTSRSLSNAETMVKTNLLGVIRMIDAFIDHLKGKPDAAIVNVSSGTGFVPYAASPTYSATKAAVHTYTAALRPRLAGSVEMIEVVPPQVATNLTPGLKASPQSVPLDAFADEVMAILDQQPTGPEVIVQSVRPFRYAEREGRMDELIASMLHQ